MMFFQRDYLLFHLIFPSKKSNTMIDVTMTFRLFFLPNFATNQQVSNMKIITFESKAYKELDNKITAIANYIFNHLDENKTDEDEIWVDSYEVCTFLKISDRTLQRLRASGMISYSDIKGHYFYKIKEVKRMLEERLIKRDKECINELITNHQKYVKERRNSKQNK